MLSKREEMRLRTPRGYWCRENRMSSVQVFGEGMKTQPDAKNFFNRRQVYEKNIHDTMKSLPQQRDRRKKDYERVLTLFDTGEHARDRRNKVCGV